MKTRYIDMYKIYTRGKAIYWRKSGVSEFGSMRYFLSDSSLWSSRGLMVRESDL